MSFHNIIAAVDLSPVSDAVCEQAFALAQSSMGKVHLVHVLTLSELSEATLRKGGALHEAHEVAERELRTVAEPHLASGRVGQLIVREGDPSSTLTKLALELHADLIVVDTHHRGLVRLAQGSVAASLVHDAPCAVLVLRPNAQAER